MIPILYESREEIFASNGIGRLTDAIRCRVTEERNGIYELEMSYPLDGVNFEGIAPGAYIKAVPFVNGKPQIFCIYEVSKPLDGITTIYAAHLSYRMGLIPSRPFEGISLSDTVKKLKESALERCPFSFWIEKDNSNTYKSLKPNAIKDKIQGSQGSILQTYSPLEIEWDNWEVKIWQNRGQDKGAQLRYGKNITSLKQDENIRNLWTGVVPYWYGMTEDSDEEELVMLDEILYTDTVGLYPYHRTGCLDLTGFLEEKPTQAALRSRALRYIKENDIGYPKVNVNVSFVDLSKTEDYKDFVTLESVNLCDTITIRYDNLGVNVKAKVLKTVYNVLLDRYESVQVGNYTDNGLAETIAGGVK